jgi:hypothetical protein
MGFQNCWMLRKCRKVNKSVRKAILMGRRSPLSPSNEFKKLHLKKG